MEKNNLYTWRYIIVCLCYLTNLKLSKINDVPVISINLKVISFETLLLLNNGVTKMAWFLSLRCYRVVSMVFFNDSSVKINQYYADTGMTKKSDTSVKFFGQKWRNCFCIIMLVCYKVVWTLLWLWFLIVSVVLKIGLSCKKDMKPQDV